MGDFFVLFGGFFVITIPQDLRSICKSDRRQCGVELAKLLAEGEQSALPEASHSSEKQEEIMLNASRVAISWLFHRSMGKLTQAQFPSQRFSCLFGCSPLHVLHVLVLCSSLPSLHTGCPLLADSAPATLASQTYPMCSYLRNFAPVFPSLWNISSQIHVACSSTPFR